MSSASVVNYFKDENIESIINWMVTNMTPEQIRGCLGEATEELSDAVESDAVESEEMPPLEDVNDLQQIRKICEDKRYIIHEVKDTAEGKKVSFWYFMKKGTWKYYKDVNIESFEGDDPEECGKDTLLTDLPEDKQALAKEKYLTDDQFKSVREEYETQGINTNWLTKLEQSQPNILPGVINESEQIKKTLSDASNLQKQTDTLVTERGLSDIFKFAPIIIVSADTDNNVTYFYLAPDESGNVTFKSATSSVNELNSKMQSILDNLSPDNLSKELIKAKAKELKKQNLDQINASREIYDEFPLSDKPKYFMTNLFTWPKA